MSKAVAEVTTRLSGTVRPLNNNLANPLFWLSREHGPKSTVLWDALGTIKAHPLPGLLAFTIFLGVACCQILGDQNTVSVRPTASPSGLGKLDVCVESEYLPGSETLFAPCFLHGHQESRPRQWLRLPRGTHGKVGFVRTSFPSQKLYAKRQNRGFPQRSEMGSEANYSIFCKGQHTLESCGNTGTSTLSASLRSAAGWKASTGTGSPGKCIFRFPFAKDYTCLLINP